MQIDLLRPRTDADWAALQAAWRALEETADSSFFQSWTWIGCRARERYTDPLLVRATDAGQVVGLALFNRTAPPLTGLLLPSLWLHETGRPPEDSVFIEHNGPLVARDRPDLLGPMLAAALRRGRLMLSGVSDTVRDAAATIGQCHALITRPAPFAQLSGQSAGDWLDSLGTSTRYHLRRSRRRYEAKGPIVLRHAADLPEALAFLAELAALHQARWEARGKPGAFAEPAFLAFHRALLARGLPRNEVQLLRVAAASTVLGYLYNFHWRGRVYAYQGGFDYAGAGAHQAPGLTCHHAAIEAAIAAGCTCYDFLAGEARYKTSLSNGVESLHWLAVNSGHGLHDLALMARRRFSPRG